MKTLPKDIQLIGNELAIRWPNNKEHFLKAALLRKHSPSAENLGEQDILGNHYGPKQGTINLSVEIDHFNPIGNYAIQIHFSDGHNTGIFSWDYLYKIGEGNLD